MQKIVATPLALQTLSMDKEHIWYTMLKALKAAMTSEALNCSLLHQLHR